MKGLKIKAIDVFTTTPFGGNPAGVITNADGLSIENMQGIAGEMKMNLIEIAFVTSSNVADTPFRVRYFTPSEELNVSGHVTIATCYALIEDGKIDLCDGLTKVNLLTNIGKLPVEIHLSNDHGIENRVENQEGGVYLSSGRDTTGRLEKIMMYQPLQRYSPARTPIDEMAKVLGIDPGEITGTGLPMTTASSDLDWLLIPVLHKETILTMQPDLIKLGILNRIHGIKTNHVFSLDTYSDDCVAYSRHFGPAVGLWEDPGSAMASAGLGAYLVTHGIATSGSMTMEQGNKIDGLSRIFVEVDHNNGQLSAVRVGGLAVTSIVRTLDIETREVLNV
jgi:trans-2,3-dihydro-3-hydroxyanthranilate isomerase